MRGRGEEGRKGLDWVGFVKVWMVVVGVVVSSIDIDLTIVSKAHVNVSAIPYHVLSRCTEHVDV